MAAPASRIVALDALRGAGILGILAVHIQLFAMPVAARSNPTAYGDLSGAAGAVWLATYVLADGKFIAIFAILFGAGIAMQAARCAAAGLPAAPPHFRRMAALLLIGVLHAYLLWYGDMLAAFALCGAMVFQHRDLRPARMIVAGTIVLSAAPLLSTALVWIAPDSLASSAATQEAVAREIAAYRGGWLLQQSHRVPTAWEFQTSYFLLRGVWQTSGLTLLGMGLWRTGVLTGERRVVAPNLGPRSFRMREEVEIVDRHDLSGCTRGEQQGMQGVCHVEAGARQQFGRRPAEAVPRKIQPADGNSQIDGRDPPEIRRNGQAVSPRAREDRDVDAFTRIR